MHPRRQWKLALAAMALPFVAAASLLAVLELGGRIQVHYKYGVPGKRYGIYQADPELGATHRPNSYNSKSTINNFGFRNASDITELKPPGALRVYCSGGSTTFCYNLTTDEAWPTRLEERLREAPGHERDEVINAGQILHSVGHEFAVARRFLPRLRPDIVVLFTGPNEGNNARTLVEKEDVSLDRLFAEQRFGVITRSYDQARFLKRNSVLVRYWDYVFKPLLDRNSGDVFRSPTAPADWQSWADFHPWVIANQEHTLRAYLRFVREQGATPIVVRYADNGLPSWYLERGLRAWRDTAVRVAQEEGVVICDVASAVEARRDRAELFSQSGIHVTSAGVEVMVRELTKTILGLAPALAADDRPQASR